MKNKTLSKGGKIGEILRSREASLMLVMALLVAVIQWRSGGKFLSPTVIYQLTQNYAYTAVLAFGMLLVLLIGGIDISETVNGLLDVLLPVLVAFGIVNNPTDRSNF